MIHIKEPFYTAGRKYGWVGKPIGIGINLQELVGDDTIEITVGNSPKVWIISKTKARELIKTYQSYYDARGTRLGVLPWQAFETKK